MKYHIKNKKGLRSLKRLTGLLAVIVINLLFIGCNNYLDIVPDNVATIDKAFTMRTEAEKYLFTLYSYLPVTAAPGDVQHMGGDECWFQDNGRSWTFDYNGFYIAQGNQGINDPYVNYWDGTNGGVACFQAIRDCNIFLENVSDLTKVRDLSLDERTRWLGEAEFLKAYYHFILLRSYGPIPIIDKNLPVSASSRAVRIRRMPVDSCVNYIATLLDSAVAKLPLTISNTTDELGRITKPIALAVKAKVLLTAASPLFNGNSDYRNFRDKEGVLLFNPTNDASKWKRAADAAKMAITSAESAGFKLYKFTDAPYHLSDTTMTQMGIRNAVCDPWNSEVVWGNSQYPANKIQLYSMGYIFGGSAPSGSPDVGEYAATMKMADLFYTKNGVPINEDKTLDFSVKNQLRTATHDERFYISEGYETARLNFDREPRFYADLGFDGGVWYMYDSPSRSDENTYVLEAKAKQYGNSSSFPCYNASGYFIKKLTNWKSVFSTATFPMEKYPWPEIRLADLYLMYAEALNEESGSTGEVLNYVDRIRSRAGIPSVEDSWTNYSTNPDEYTTKDGMRSIIHQERLIELAFEGSRFWDLRRWKEANEELNKPIMGWSVREADAASYYQSKVLLRQSFVAPRDYLWPIKEYDLTVDPELVQNPGW